MKSIQNKGQIQFLLIIALAVAFLSVIFVRLFTIFTPQLLLVFSAGLLLVFITFINTDMAIIVLIFSMLLSPELKVADVPEKSVVIRIDDILLIMTFFAWLAKTAINKELGLLKKTPLNLPIFMYIAACIVFTLRGIILGFVTPKTSFFFLLKYIEYFILYFLVVNNLRETRQIKMFVIFVLITCAIVLGYCYTQFPQAPRITAPFEGEHGEPNTLAGYLVLMFALISGLFLYTGSMKWRIFLGSLLVAIVPIFLHTFSRGGYLGFMAMYLSLLVLTKRKKPLLIILMVLFIFFSHVLLPPKVKLRIETTFRPGRTYTVLGREIALDYSASQRVVLWKDVLARWQDSPLFGFGITGVGIVDTQYPRVLGELGLIGLAIFIWLIGAIFKQAMITFNTVEDDWLRGLSLGFIAGFIGLLAHCFGANIFIIVRIMEPFWLLTAIIITLPEIIKESPQAIYGAR